MVSVLDHIVIRLVLVDHNARRAIFIHLVNDCSSATTFISVSNLRFWEFGAYTCHHGGLEHGWVRFLYINESGKRAGAATCHIFDGFCKDPCRLLLSALFLKSKLCRAEEVLFVHKLADSRRDRRFEKNLTIKSSDVNR